MMKSVKEMSREELNEAILALRDSLDILGSKWKIIIIIYLSVFRDEQNHFKQIQRGIQGISAKMLSKELKELEMNNLVNRHESEETPITVYYTITDYGLTVLPVARVLTEWGLEHRRVIKENRF